MKKIHKKVMALLLAALMITSVMDTHVQAESSTEANNISVVNDGTGDAEEVSDVEKKDKKENADETEKKEESDVEEAGTEAVKEEVEGSADDEEKNDVDTYKSKNEVAGQAAKKAPTEVESCETSGFYSNILNFKFGDTTWMDAITAVSVNGDTSYTKGSINSFGASGKLWNIGNATGAYGSYTALQITGFSSSDYPLTVKIKASGYEDVTMKVVKTTVSYQDIYTATIESSGSGENPDPVVPSEEKDAPVDFKVSSNFGYDFIFEFGTSIAKEWLAAITGVTVDETAWTQGSSSYSVWNNQSYYVDKNNGYIYIGENFSSETAVCVISATGYKPLTLELNKSSHKATVKTEDKAESYAITVEASENGTVTSDKAAAKAGETVTLTVAAGASYELDTLTVTGTSSKVVDTTKTTDGTYTFTMPGEAVNVTATFKEYVPGQITVSNVVLSQDYFGQKWYFTFDINGYAENITAFKVNNTAWTKNTLTPSLGGQYYPNINENRIEVAAKSYSTAPGAEVLKSGDSIIISATGYSDLALKFIVNTNGKASLVADDGKGDPYELRVKIDGSFEAAIVGQKDYDGVSGASSGGTSSNKNSAVTVYGALVEKGSEVQDSDWEPLNHQSKISLNGKNCTVNIVPDTQKGTKENSDSGMKGVYLTLSSDLTLDGTPKDAGKYLISISVEDYQGRTAVSNALPFVIYTGEETLVDQIKTENLRKYSNGLYAWDIMEPWAIKNFGSNVSGETESVRIPKDLEVWFGSHQSGTYGYLGYDITWDQVKAGNIPQTLYIPDGCSLTLTNMEILSSVRIVVESGGKLTLSDSVVQGIIDVQGGGTFSMNYDAFNRVFTTGASVCGQVRLADDAILENAAIYSHTNYLANGDKTDRSNDDPVVQTTGNVTVKGQVYIKGDEAGSTGKGQTALGVKNGTITLADDAVLATYGGGGNILPYAEGGNALKLENGTVTGNGKLIAIGGNVLWGNGGTAVTGNGEISTSQAFLQGATASDSKHAIPGKATKGLIKVISPNRHVEDGTQITGVQDDPLAGLYWKTGIDAVPALDQYTITTHVHEADTTQWKSDENGHWNPCIDPNCDEHLNQAAHTFLWKTDVEPTTSTEGSKHEECTVCGYTRNENTKIDKLPANSGSGSHKHKHSSSGNSSDSSAAASTQTADTSLTAAVNTTAATTKAATTVTSLQAIAAAENAKDAEAVSGIDEETDDAEVVTDSDDAASDESADADDETAAPAEDNTSDTQEQNKGSVPVVPIILLIVVAGGILIFLAGRKKQKQDNE